MDERSTHHRTLTVSGRGRASRPPDEAEITLGVDIVRPTATEARDAAASAMSRVIAAVLDQGVAADDARTSDLSLGPEIEYLPDGTMRRAGFRLTNRISVRVARPDEVAAILDAALEAGATAVEAVRFVLADERDARGAALAAAVEDARAGGEVLARAAGTTLGPVRSIREGSDGAAPPSPRYAVMEARAADTPVLAGTTEIHASVQVTWDLTDPVG